MVLSAQSQANHPGFGQIGKVNEWGYLLFKVVESHCQARFHIVDNHKGVVLNVLIGDKTLDKLRNYLALHHLFGLKWHTGHRHEHFAILFKPHDGCCAHLVLDYAATRRHHCLGSGEGVEFQVALFENLKHILLYLGAVHKRAAKVAAKCRLGDIVFCRSKPSCGENDVGVCKSVVDGAENLLAVVADDFHASYAPTERIEVAGNPPRVSIGHLPYQ